MGPFSSPSAQSSPDLGDRTENMQIVSAELVDEPKTASPSPTYFTNPTVSGRKGMLRKLWFTGNAVFERLLGLAALVVALAFLATYPILQMLSLGYLLEASARVARSGRLRDGVFGVDKAARFGSIALGVWLLLLPLRFASSMAGSARLIDPASPAHRVWSIVVIVLTVMIVLQIIGACWRGGKLRDFLWPAPFKLAREVWRGGAYARARDAASEFTLGLRLPYYFWLGLRGFLGGLAWLFVPVTMLAVGREAPVIGAVGGILLFAVLLYLPFLQTRFATENRFRAMFEIRPVRAWFRRAPLAFLLALTATLAFALPLYILKIEMIPREAAWLPSLVFVLFILPARLLNGWACGRAQRQTVDRNRWVRLSARGAMVPIVAFYLLVVYFSQFTSWHGIQSLYGQHAFLVPVPFLGL